MVKFLIYLFESGFCLAVMYLVYYFFLRKETYFVFNRIYLTAVAGISLLIPLVHISVSVPDTGRIETPVSKIFRFRTYYEQVIALTDPEYTARPVQFYPAAEFSEGPGGTYGMEGRLSPGDPGLLRSGQKQAASGMVSGISGLRLADAILILYLLGALFFIFRFLLLVYWLIQLARKYGIQKLHGISLIDFSEDMSPFSFFRYVFINGEALSDEDYELILAHEHVHIRQWHSLDLMVAQVITVLQWFNPFAWLLRDAIKSTHEFIADRRVIRTGPVIQEYQSLLLKQLITSRPVELVNNFNLKPIKTRIAMMTKIKSGFPARLKAMLVIPFAFALFLMFADMSFRGPGKTVFNYAGMIENRQDAAALSGLWKSKEAGARGQVVRFEEGRIHILEEPATALIYEFSIQDGHLVLKQDPVQKQGIPLKYRLEADQLSIWWSDKQKSLYHRTGAQNTLELLLQDIGMDIDLPELSHYRVLEQQGLVYRLYLGLADNSHEPELILDGEKTSLAGLGASLEKTRAAYSKLDVPYLTALMYVDRDVPMKYVHELKQVMRRHHSLKFAAACIPADREVTPVLLHAVGQPRLLPPGDAKLLDKEELIRNGMNIHTIDLAVARGIPAAGDTGLKEFIGKSGKYIIELVYDDEVSYGEYMAAVDQVFLDVFSFRDETARAQYGTAYDELPGALQSEIRKKYPMTLTERNADR